MTTIPSPLPLEQIRHRQAERSDDLFGTAAGVAVEEHPFVVACGDRQRCVAVGMARAARGPAAASLADALEPPEHIADRAHRTASAVLLNGISPSIAAPPGGVEAAPFAAGVPVAGFRLTRKFG